MAELGSLFETGNFSSGTETQHIEEEMMDFDYVKKCNDITLVKAILRRLQSGKDGHYPDLIRFTEDRVLELLPPKDRKRMETLKKAATIEEIQEAEAEMTNWQDSISSRDKSLKDLASGGGENKEIFPTAQSVHMVPVRGVRGTSTLSPSSSDTAANIHKSQSQPAPSAQLQHVSSSKDTDEAKRISGYDFRAWEKYDPEQEISLLDAEERAQHQQLQQVKTNLQSQQDSAAARRRKHHEALLEKLRSESDWSQLSETARSLKSDRERLKGNEAFKVKEYDNAYDCYSRSIAYSASSQSYANRAMAGIKLERYEVAIDDCTRALALDPTYSKALVRRGMARTCVGQYGPAIEDFSEALTKDPGNAELLKLRDKARSKYREVEGREYGEAPSVYTGQAIPIEFLSGVSDLPSLGSHEHVKSGMCDTSTHSNTSTTPPPITSHSTDNISAIDITSSDTSEQKFTRIAISADDSDDDDEEEEEPRDAAAEDDDTNERVQSNVCTTGGTSVAVAAHTPAHEEVPVLPAPTIDPEWSMSEGNRLKVEGNSAAGIGDTETALRLYTASLDVDPSNTKSRNNRAQMLLKLGRFAECIQDSLAVIETEPMNIKAIFRAGQAYEGMLKYADAQQMYEKILTIEPLNSSAQISLSKVQEKLKSDKKPSAVVVQQKAANPSSTKPVVVAKDLESEAVSTPVPASKPKVSSIEQKVHRKLDVIRAKAKEPAIPTSQPASVYELERVWRGLRGRADLFAVYLSNFKKSTYKKVFKDTLSHDLIGCLLRAIRDHISDDLLALTILEGFSKMEKLKMTLALLPEEDLSVLGDVFKQLEVRFANVDDEGIALASLMTVKRLFSQ